MVGVRVYVEGGGDKRGGDLASECRRAFGALFSQFLPTGRKPRIIACGGRNQAYDAFQTAVRQHPQDLVLLLVDSEDAVMGTPWAHLDARDGWRRPHGVSEDHAHLMVRCMEAWFIADREALARYFGSGFKGDRIPKWPDVERVPRERLFEALHDATRECRPGAYDKGRHSFKVLAGLRADAIRQASPHAHRLFTTLARALSP